MGKGVFSVVIEYPRGSDEIQHALKSARSTRTDRELLCDRKATSFSCIAALLFFRTKIDDSVETFSIDVV